MQLLKFVSDIYHNMQQNDVCSAKKMFLKPPNKNMGSQNVYPIISKEQPINPSANGCY